MRITVTDYLDVVSSWCFWSEPTWAELKKRYQGRVEFQWKIALMDPSGLPTSREQHVVPSVEDDAVQDLALSKRTFL